VQSTAVDGRRHLRLLLDGVPDSPVRVVPELVEPPEHLPIIGYERHPGAAMAPLPREYRRHEPEKTVLHTIVLPSAPK